MIEGPGPSLGYLIYLSSSTDAFNQKDLRNLLELSRIANALRGITGILLYRDRHFFQYLEGSTAIVEETYAHIKIDKRHYGARVLGRGQLSARLFPGWQMGYKSMTGMRASSTVGYSDCLQPNFIPTEEGDPSERLMRLFYERIGRSE